MGQRLAIVGMGMLSPVGYQAPATCASLRAGITRLRELEGLVDERGLRLRGARVPGLKAEEHGVKRLAEMAAISLAEAISHIPSEFRRHVRLSLAMRDGARPGDYSTLPSELRASFESLGLPKDTQLDVHAEGNAAGFRSLANVRQRMIPGARGIEIVMGVDSLLDVPTLSYLAAANRLKQGTQPRGAMPGEACACLVLASERAARQAGLRSMALIEGIGLAKEPVLAGQDAPLLAEGLTRAISLVLEEAGWSGNSVRQVNADLNGETYRSREWMLARPRTLGEPHVVHPADCIGDVGAAFAPLLIGMAAVALQRGYARGDRVLVFCSSDSGLRAACAVASGG